MIVTEYDSEEWLISFIQKLDQKISNFKDVKLQLSYGVYTVEDNRMELRQMEDRAAMARKAAKNNILANIYFIKNNLRSLYITGSLLKKICRQQFQRDSL